MKNFFKARFAPLLGITALIAVIGFSMAACGGDDDDDGGGGGSNLKKVSITIGNDYSKTLTNIEVFTPFASGGGDLTRHKQDVSIATGGSPVTIKVSLPFNDDETVLGIYFTFADGKKAAMGDMGGYRVKFTDFPQTYTIAANGNQAIDKNGKTVFVNQGP
jgi:hypothetical protein